MSYAKFKDEVLEQNLHYGFKEIDVGIATINYTPEQQYKLFDLVYQYNLGLEHDLLSNNLLRDTGSDVRTITVYVLADDTLSEHQLKNV